MRWLTFWSTFVSFLMLTSVAAAHKDYAGDVHPTVSEREGNFVVQFVNNRTSKYFETVVTPGGEVTKKRVQRKAKHESKSTRLLGANGNEVRFGFEGEWFVFPHWPPSTPEHRRFRVEQNGRVVGKGELPASIERIEKLERMLVTREQFILLGRPEENELTFYSAPRSGTQPLLSGRIGVPARIYDFPIVSNIASFEKSVLIAWIDTQQELQISTWNTWRAEAPTTVQLGSADDNTSLSIHVIGSNLLLAYHTPDPARPGAMIRMVHCHLPIVDRSSCRFL